MPEKLVTIESLGPQGDGITPGGPERIYVAGGVPGDKLRVGVRRDLRGVLRGRLKAIESGSAHRRAAPCPHYRDCGNCSVQHLEPTYYRAWKAQVVTEALNRYKVRLPPTLEPQFLPAGSRRRACFTAAYGPKGPVLGYYGRRSDRVTSIESCLLASDRLLELRTALLPWVGQLLHPRFTLDCFFQTREGQTELLFTGPIGRQGRPVPQMENLMGRLAEALSLAQVSWRPNPNVSATYLVRRAPFRARFGSLDVELPPGAFQQPTPEGEAALVKAVLAATPDRLPIADLFSGCGTFSGPLLTRGPVEAFELCPQACRSLGRAAQHTQGLSVWRRDLFADPIPPSGLNKFGTVVLDPPRAGCAEQVRALAQSRVANIVYVSCNPATFARDASKLRKSYHLESVQLIDQFLWSHHVELVAVFRHR